MEPDRELLSEEAVAGAAMIKKRYGADFAAWFPRTARFSAETTEQIQQQAEDLEAQAQAAETRVAALEAALRELVLTATTASGPTR